MANRYDSGSVSNFNPLSYQELAVTPMMMRQKHDNSIAAAKAMRIKANPLDKHLARAVELKQQMDNEIANNVDTLNKEGYNPTTFQNITKLNRQYQDLISPTGEIGQINAAKTVYDTNQEEFIKDAAKQNIGRGRAIDLWQEKTAYYTGFGEDGKSIRNVSPQGVVAYQDYEKYKQVAKSLMGEVESESRNGGYQLRPSGLGNGTMIMVNSKGFQKESTNLDSLNNAILAGSEMWLKPTGEGYKYNQDAGVDQNNFKQRFIGDFGSMLRTSKGSGYEENGQFINDASGPNGESNLSGSGTFGEDYNTKEVGGKDQDYSEIERIGKSKTESNIIGYDQTTHQPIYSKDPIKASIKSDEIKDPRIKTLYNNAFKNATTGKGIMLDGKLVKLNPSLIKKGKDDPIVAAQLLRSIKQNPAITLTSKLLTTNQVLNNQGFVAGLGTTADDVDKNIRRQLQRDDASGRKLVDPETGKTISWNDAAKEYGFENINDVNYQGQISAHNWEEDNDKLGSNSSFSPHVVTIKDKNDKWHSFKTTRLNSDNIGGNVARQNDLTKNYRNATINYGDFIDFESSSNNLKGIQIKYNPNEQEYDSETGEPKTWTIKFKNKPEEKATESQYMNWVNSVK